MNSVEMALNNVRTHFLIAGIANAVLTVVGSVLAVTGGIATCGVGCLLFFLPMINIGVMISDFLAMSKIRESPTSRVYSFLKMASIFDIFACFAIVPLVMGVLNLQILGRPDVHAYFHGDDPAA